MASLSKLQFLILASLIEGPMHAYAIRQSIIDLTLLKYSPCRSSIAGSLESLGGSGLINSWMEDPMHWLKARRGQPYCLTEKGLWLVQKELEIYANILKNTEFWLVRNKAYGPQRELFNQALSL